MPRIHKTTLEMLGITYEEYLEFCERYMKNPTRTKTIREFCDGVLNGKIIRSKVYGSRLMFVNHYKYKQKKESAVNWNVKDPIRRRKPRVKKDKGFF